MPTTVLIVVVTYNSEAVVLPLLDSLPLAMGSIQSVTVVVDNGSTDRTVALLDKRTDCTVVRSENHGYAAGINRGVRENPDATAILVLNPDVVLAKDAVPRMLAALSRRGIGVVAPSVHEADGSLSTSIRREPTLLRALGLGRTRHPLLAETVTPPTAYTYGHMIEWAMGAVLLVSGECHKALGGWDETFFLYSEEADFSLRARDHGFGTWFEPSASAMHIGGASGVSASTHTMQVLNRVRLYRRRHRQTTSLIYFGLTILGEVSWWARGNPYSKEAILALLKPSRRPQQLNASNRLIPN